MHTTYFFSGLVLGLILARIKAWALHRWRFGKAKPKAISLLPPTDEQLPFLAYVVEQNEAPPGLQIQEEIGVGCGGHVFKGIWNGARVAVKQVWHEPAGFDSNSHASQEALFSLASVHPNVVATYKVFTTPSAKPALHNTTADAASLAQSPSGAIKSFTVSSYCLTTLLVMEYCECGTLQDRHFVLWELLESRPLEGMKCILNCLIEVVVALEYLHSIGIVHGDLKCSNVLCQTSNFDARGYRCLIGDFGLSRFIRVGYEGYTQRPGAVIFAAPEKMLTGLICGAGDVFSFGMIACFLTSKDASLLLDAQEIYKESGYTWRPDLPAGTPALLQELIMKCWSHEYACRPSCFEVRQLVTEQLQGLD